MRCSERCRVCSAAICRAQGRARVVGVSEHEGGLERALPCVVFLGDSQSRCRSKWMFDALHSAEQRVGHDGSLDAGRNATKNGSRTIVDEGQS